MSLKIKINKNALNSAIKSLESANDSLKPIVTSINNLKVDNKKIVPSIRQKMNNAIEKLETELNRISSCSTTFQENLSSILSTIKELDEKYETLSTEQTGALFWKETIYQSENSKVLQELVTKLNEQGLMTASGLFASTTLESPYASGTFVPADQESREKWKQELVDKYMEEGQSEEDAKIAAEYDMAKAELESTGATVLAGGQSIYSLLLEKNKALSSIETIKGDTTPPGDVDGDTTPPGDVDDDTTPLGDADDVTTTEGSENNPQVIQDKQNSSTKAPSSSTSNNTPSNTQQKVEQSKPDATPSETLSNNTENSSNNNTNTENPSTGDESNNSNTNNGGNTNTNSNTSNGANSNNTLGENTESNTPINNDNTNTNTNTNTGGNTYYGTSNSSSGNYNNSSYSNNNPTIISDSNVDAGNASTTTPSAPESDAGITDNTGETLDVISIDKDGGKSSASTSSNDGGSVVPTILGVGVAGAAAVAGAKILHDKKKKENEYTYEDDNSTSSDNSFADLETYTDNNIEDTADTISPEKYKAGSANDLVLEGNPSDIKIDESIADIPNQKEELE